MALTWNPWKSIVICRDTWKSDHSVFMIQIAISAFFTSTAKFILGRFGFSSFFSNMVGAIIIGPTVLGYANFFKEFIFPYHSLQVLETLHYLGNMFFPFLVGLKMDFRMVNGAGREAKIIGISVGVFPILIAYLTSSFIKNQYFPTNLATGTVLCSVAVTATQTSFHDVACLLADLKILNSKIGRLATASSMISNSISFTVMLMMSALIQSKQYGGKLITGVGSVLGLLLFVVYALRPIIHWMIRQISHGTNKMKEVQLLTIFLMVLVCSFLGQSLGHSPGMGPLFLGLVVPPGPPLAEAIEEKLESIVSYVFLPLFYCACSGKVVVGGSDADRLMIVGLILFLSFFTKIISTVISSIYCGKSLNDALVLGFILASPGIMLLIYFSSSLRYKNIDGEVYAILLYSSVVTAGITSILVKLMYRPSRDYLTYDKRTLQDSINNSKFEILACIYRDSNVPSIMDLLEASNPTNETQISLYLLHLIELQRIAPPFLISHKRDDIHSIYYDRSKHIISAFRFFEKQFKEKILLKAFSTLSPCVTMHQDICSLAVEKGVSLIILPFHRQFNSEGIIEASTTIRNVNFSVLNISPCSVGILVNRPSMNGNNLLAQSKPFFHIALIFLGGADDREVLTYGMRMANNPSTKLTVIRFRVVCDTNNKLENDKELDEELLDDFRGKYIGKEGMTYRDEMVSESVGLLKPMREVEDRYDIIMVGRQQENASKLFEGLYDWNEYPELGVMGDMLATSHFFEDIPILVLQQKLHSSDDLVLGPDYTIHV